MSKYLDEHPFSESAKLNAEARAGHKQMLVEKKAAMEPLKALFATIGVSVDPLVTADTTPALSGAINDPSAAIEVTVDGNAYTATNNADGTWSLADNTITPALAVGVYDVEVEATSADGEITGINQSEDELEIE